MPQAIFDPANHPHRRHNPLTGDWVLVSPHRAHRPWQGQTEKADESVLPRHDPACYLCAGNTRINGQTNPQYQGPFVFDNDFAALKDDTPEYSQEDGLFRCTSVKGISRVICYSERHDLTLSQMKQTEIVALINVWSDQYRELEILYRWVQIFENKGAINGCSNPHPHGQIWASNILPTLPAREDEHQKTYFVQHQKPLLLDYAQQEMAHGDRLVCSNKDWIAVVPYWASWPFEILLLPLHPIERFTDLDAAQKDSLAIILKQLTCVYDNLFQTSFPYSMGWHGAPGLTDTATDHWQLHAHFYPPLLRSATIKKFMVGYEMLAEPQRDLTPEQAAERLRAVTST